MSTPHLGVLGGTFDPIHNGHIRAAEAARSTLGLDAIRVIPSHDPPHRPVDPRASAFHRFAMVAIAIDGLARWELSDAELTRSGPSYTADTLRSLHAEGWAPSQIFFILGSDAFAEIATWHEFPAVLDLANFAIVARAGITLAQAAARTDAVSRRLRPVVADGAVASINAVETGIFLVEAATPDISSSAIRERLATRRSIEGLVPAPVARYIQTQHLYGSNVSNDPNDFPVKNLHGKAQRIHR